MRLRTCGSDVKTHFGKLAWSEQHGYGTVLCIGHAQGRARVFRKFYRYLDAHVARYEYQCALSVYEQGIPTARPIRLVDHQVFGTGIEFSWMALSAFDARTPTLAAQDVLELARRLHSASAPDPCQDWSSLVAAEYGPELERAKAWCLKQDEQEALQRLGLAINSFDALVVDGFVHGDLSPANVGYSGETLYCLDLRHASTGPADWDVGYFLCHMEPTQATAQAILAAGARNHLIDLAIVASAIRLGRRLRRGDDPTPGWLRLSEWMGEKRQECIHQPQDHERRRHSVGSIQVGLEFLRHGLLDSAERAFTHAATSSIHQKSTGQLNLAVILHVRGHFQQARALYEAALASVGRQHAARVYLNLGILHLQLRDPDASRHWLECAQRHAPDDVAIAVTRLAWFHSFRTYLDGISEFEKLRITYPDHPLTAVMCNSGANLYAAAGQWKQAVACWAQAQAFDPDYWNAGTNGALACLDRLPGPEVVRQASDSFYQRCQYFPPREGGPRMVRKPPSHKNIRIGIVSCKIRRGKAGYLVRALLSYLDRQRFGMIVYDNAVCIDRFSAPLQAMADEWIGVFGWSATRLAERIRDDNVDVLIDLDGHCPRNFALAFWMQAAPVQLSTGAFSVQDVLDDVPAFKSACMYFHAFDEGLTLTHRKLDTALRLAYIGDADKLDDTTLSLFCHLLAQLPSSTLTLKSVDFDDGALVGHFKKHFADAGIRDERIRFVGFIKGHRHHLAFHQEIDLLIDSVGRSSQMAIYEALQHGVPVLAVDTAGPGMVGGAQVLRSFGLPGFVAEDTHALLALCQAAGSDQVLSAWRAAARSAFVKYQNGLEEQGRKLGELIDALHQSSVQTADWSPICHQNRHEIESFESDGSWLLLNSCFGDHVLLSVFE